MIKRKHKDKKIKVKRDRYINKKTPIDAFLLLSSKTNFDTYAYFNAACAAANLAIGTLNGLQLT